MKKGELKKHDKDYLDYKTILTTMLCTLVGVLFVLCLIFVGIRMATGKTLGGSSADVEIISINYGQQQYNYSVQDWQLSKDTKAAYIFTDLETKYSGDNYAVINSKTQLDTLLQTLNGITNQNNFYEIEESFFTSSSIIAIALEHKEYSSYNIASITRDASYNLQVNIDAIRLNDDAISETSGAYASLYLIRVPNIQPRLVGLSINTINE